MDEETVHTGGGAEAEMDAGVVGGEHAAARLYLAGLLLASSDDGDPRPEGVAGAT